MNETNYDDRFWYGKIIGYLRIAGKKTFVADSLFREMEVAVHGRTNYRDNYNSFNTAIKKLLNYNVISIVPKNTQGGATIYQYPARQIEESVDQVTAEDTKKAELLVRLNKVSNELGSIYFELENLKTNLKTTTLSDFTKDELVDEIMRRIN